MVWLAISKSEDTMRRRNKKKKIVRIKNSQRLRGSKGLRREDMGVQSISNILSGDIKTDLSSYKPPPYLF